MNVPAESDASSVVDRVFAVLETCAASDHSLTLAELVRRTALPKTTLHRVCWKLVELGMLSHGAGGFRMGPRLFALASSNPALRQLRASAMPYLHQLLARTGWQTSLAVMSHGRALIVDEVFGGDSGSRPSMIGALLPLHATAIGKALLAGYTPQDLADLLGNERLAPITPRTLVRPQLLCAQIEASARTHIFVSREEWSMGTWGAASPVRVDGDVVAAVGIVGPPGDAGLRQRAGEVRNTAARIGLALTPDPLAVGLTR